jgi:hypothetical protein
LPAIQPVATPTVSLNLEIRAGYIIDLSDDPPPMRRIENTSESP